METVINLEKDNLKEVSDKRRIADKIYTIRGVQVMLDSDLAELYGYEVKKLNQQVKRNKERFPEDFMFQLTEDEIELVRSQFVTSRENDLFRGQAGGRRYLPYVFTEQGVYMLATVLKSEIAVKQSIMIIRTFKEMRHYLHNNRQFMTAHDFIRLSMQVNDNTKAIQEIKEEMVTKSYYDEVMKEFIGPNRKDEYTILDGEKFTAVLAYQQIYQSAKKTIYIIDNYIGVKTLLHLKDLSDKIQIILFSDNLGQKLSLSEFQDFHAQYPKVNIKFQTTQGKFHDRYIILDYKTADEVIYHCGASSKDAGNKITTMNRIKENEVYKEMIKELLMNPVLVLK